MAQHAGTDGSKTNSTVMSADASVETAGDDAPADDLGSIDDAVLGGFDDTGELTVLRGRGMVVMVCSTRAGQGASTVAANLAAVCAIADRRVVLVDADFVVRRCTSGSRWATSRGWRRC